MKPYFLALFWGWVSLFPPLTSAMIETYPFDNAQQEKDYHLLIDELRCLVCQNQNLADSNAELAQDLRKQVHKMIVTEEATKDEVVDFMVARYGDFVMYKPPVKSHTAILWLGPFLFLILGIGMVFRLFKQSQNASNSNPPASNPSANRTQHKDSNS